MAVQNNASTTLVAYVEERLPRRLPIFQLHLFMMECFKRNLTCHLLDRVASYCLKMLISLFVTYRKCVCCRLAFRLSPDPSLSLSLSVFPPISPVCLPLPLSARTFPCFALHFLAVLLFLLHLFSLVAPPLFPPHSFIFPPLICSIFFLFYTFPYLHFLCSPLCLFFAPSLLNPISSSQ